MSSKDVTKVLVIHPWLPEYRVAFFERLIEEGSKAGFEIRIYAPEPERKLVSRRDSLSPNWLQSVKKFELSPGGRSLIYKRVLISLLKSKPDIVVVEHAAKNLETYLIFLLRHLFRFNVIIWGHGKTYASKDSGVGRKMKILLAQHADHFLSYTEGGATYLKSFGIKDGKVTVLNNTFDTLPIAASIKITTEAELIEFAEVNQVSAGKTGLFIGGLDRDKDLDFLLEVSEQIHRIDAEFKLLVIGAGSGAAQVLRAESQGFVVYLDRLSNTEKTIPLLFASFFMIPRGIGLVAVDALLSGIPILSIRDNLHGPEHEYLIEGKSVHYASSKDSYLKLCLEFLGHSTSLMERQNLNIEELKELSIEKMVDNFISGLSKTQK